MVNQFDCYRVILPVINQRDAPVALNHTIDRYFRHVLSARCKSHVIKRFTVAEMQMKCAPVRRQPRFKPELVTFLPPRSFPGVLRSRRLIGKSVTAGRRRSRIGVTG